MTSGRAANPAAHRFGSSRHVRGEQGLLIKDCDAPEPAFEKRVTSLLFSIGQPEKLFLQPLHQPAQAFEQLPRLLDPFWFLELLLAPIFPPARRHSCRVNACFWGCRSGLQPDSLPRPLGITAESGFDDPLNRRIFNIKIIDLPPQSRKVHKVASHVSLFSQGVKTRGIHRPRCKVGPL